MSECKLVTLKQVQHQNRRMEYVLNLKDNPKDTFLKESIVHPMLQILQSKFTLLQKYKMLRKPVPQKDSLNAARRSYLRSCLIKLRMKS
ncbi:hypothetical protein KM043_015986 [Ampulex compressa]|nr:hypothetical protein KM043_015986 [Ampulex compressa]